MIINKLQESEVIAKLKPKIEKVQERQKKIEKKGKFHTLEDFLPRTDVFVPVGYDVKKYLSNYKDRLLNRNVGLKKIRT